MKLLRILALSCGLLAAHPLRTALSVGGVAVGVAAVIVMASVGRGAEERLLARIRAMGTNLIVVNAAPARIVAGRARQSETATNLFPADAQALAERCRWVVRAAAAVSRPFVAAHESRTWKTTVVGLPEDGFRIRNLAIRSGRAYDADDDRTRRRVAVLGPTVAGHLFGRDDPVGRSFLVGRVPFEVVGVSAPRGVDANGTDQDDVVLIPLETAMRRLFNVTSVQTILLEAVSLEALGAAEAEVRDVLRERRRGKADDFSLQNQALLLCAQRDASRSMKLLTGSVAGVALLVGGVGVLAVMLIAVRERTREIGLRRALGARRRDVLVQFLAEAAFLAGGGGALGVLAGAAASAAVPALGLAPTRLSWTAGAVGLGFSLAVGLVFGLYPAARAARLEPVRALRAE